MKKLFLTSALSLLASCFLFAQLGMWTSKANFGGAGRSNAVGFSIGSYGYIGTGYSGTAQKDFWRYNPANNTWTQMADFAGVARYAATGFVIGNFGYIGTGYGPTTYYKDFYKYDPSLNTWTAIANFGGNGRYFASAFSIGNNGFVGTGMDGSVAYSDFWKYNSLTNTWSSKAAYGGGLTGDCFAFALNGKGYMGCGRNFAGSTFYNSFYQYDTIANTWTAKAAFGGTVREGVGAFTIGNFGFAGIGSISNFNTRYIDFYKYDPAGNSWSAVASYPGPVAGTTNAAGFSVGNYGYLGTGYNSAQTITFYQYDMCTVTTTVTATPPSCNGGSNASINLTVAGATNPLTYLWSNSSTVQDPGGLTAGGYTVTVTDGVGCSKTTTVTVTQPTAISGNITTLTNATCYSLCNGKITVAASGATPPYAYAWSPSGGSATTATGLCAGNYSVTITDSKGCAVTTNTVITQPAAYTASASGVSATSACICDGQATVTPSGGTAPYTYLWAPGGYSTSACTGLCGGTSYTASITDVNGCSALDTASVLPLPLTATVSSSPVSCNGGNNGTAAVAVAGGAPSYSYNWNNGQTNATATGLTSGNYSVTVTDAMGCTHQSTCTVTQPAAVQVFSSASTPVSTGCLCDGSVSASVVGGTTPYTYNWSNGCSTSSCTGLCTPGNYSVSVSDSMGCIATKTVSVGGPMPFAIDSIHTIANGNATVYVATGTAPYTYSWTPGGQSSQTATALAQGTYTVCVTDADGCSYCDTVFVINNSGINEYSESSLITIYPVPVKDKFTLLMNSAALSSGEIRIVDIYGKVVFYLNSNRLNELTLDVSFLPSGMYDLVLSDDKMILTKKLILNK
jgi:hypothetical protein